MKPSAHTCRGFNAPAPFLPVGGTERFHLRCPRGAHHMQSPAARHWLEGNLLQCFSCRVWITCRDGEDVCPSLPVRLAQEPVSSSRASATGHKQGSTPEVNRTTSFLRVCPAHVVQSQNWQPWSSKGCSSPGHTGGSLGEFLVSLSLLWQII